MPEFDVTILGGGHEEVAFSRNADVRHGLSVHEGLLVRLEIQPIVKNHCRSRKEGEEIGRKKGRKNEKKKERKKMRVSEI